MTIKRPNVTLEDALALWDVLDDNERRHVFTDFWKALEAVSAGDIAPMLRLAEDWPITVLVEKANPGLHARARESKAAGPVPAHELVDVDDVIRILRS